MKIFNYLIFGFLCLLTVNKSFTGIVDATDCFKIGIPPKVKEISYSWLQKGPIYTNIGFSLFNKESKPIFVKVSNDVNLTEKIIDKFQSLIGGVEVYEIPSGKILDIPIDISKDTKLALYNCSDLKKCKNIKYEYEFTPKKTIYVTWNPSNPEDGNALFPQTGPLGLLKYFGRDLGITDRCFSKKYNVNQSDIKQIYPK